MIGCYDFCGHYEWTFDWLERMGGHELVREFWREAIGGDSQRHARELIERKGIAGMVEYWGHTLAEEAGDQGYSITSGDDVFRIDVHHCPSKGFLLANGLQQYSDYCDHCMGWIGPMMQGAGFVIDHEHNHLGQCWWEMHPSKSGAGQGSGEQSPGAATDVRRTPAWLAPGAHLDRYVRATDPDMKVPRTRVGGKQ